VTLSGTTWTALQKAMKTTDPACQDDERFVLDDQPADTLTYLCNACPLFDLCRDYAQANRPLGGVWAGKRYTHRTSRDA